MYGTMDYSKHKAKITNCLTDWYMGLDVLKPAMSMTVGRDMPSSSQIQWACYKKWKVKWEAQTRMCQWSTSTFKNSCGCTALDMPEWRETTEQINWWAKQPSQVACVLEDQKCWGAWDTTCRHKAKDVTPSLAWRREAWKEEALERWERAIVNQTHIRTTLAKERKKENNNKKHNYALHPVSQYDTERRGGAHMAFQSA